MQVQALEINTKNAGFQDKCLTAHNDYRNLHSALALKYDQEMIDHAIRRARKLAQTGEMNHDYEYLKKYKLGENLAWYSLKGGQSCAEVVKMWYDEVKHYDFGAHKGGGSGVTGHFTQVVWKSTKRVGCAQVDTDNGSYKGTHTVCVYSPPGNYVGQDAENVLPPF